MVERTEESVEERGEGKEWRREERREEKREETISAYLKKRSDSSVTGDDVEVAAGF